MESTEQAQDISQPQLSHRTVTNKPEQENPNKKEGVDYKPMGIPDVSYLKLQALLYKGEVFLDEEGFYCYGDGSFYDPDGFYFDQEGYDKYGGYYNESGNYVPGESKEDEYYQTYEGFDEDDLDEDEKDHLALMEYMDFEDEEEDEEN